MDKTLKLSNFVLKLLACIFMTLDHIGLCLNSFLPQSPGLNVAIYILRILGRLAYPIFFFLAIEGARKTSNIFKYIARLGIMFILISISIIFIEFVIFKDTTLGFYNIFTTLILVVSTYYLLVRTNKLWQKFLAIIPIFILIISSLIEFNVIYFTNTTFEKIITSIIPDYSTITLFLIFFYFIIYFILNCRINKTYKIIEASKNVYSNEEYNAYLEKKNDLYLTSTKISMSISIVFSSLICYLLTYIDGIAETTLYALSTYMIFSVIFIILYNGKLGLSNKYIKYGFYLYYPIHLLILFGIFSLI